MCFVIHHAVISRIWVAPWDLLPQLLHSRACGCGTAVPVLFGRTFPGALPRILRLSRFDCTPLQGCRSKQSACAQTGHVVCVLEHCSGVVSGARAVLLLLSSESTTRGKSVRVFSQHHIAISLCCDGHSGFHSGRDVLDKQRHPHVRRRQLFVCAHIAFMVPC